MTIASSPEALETVERKRKRVLEKIIEKPKLLRREYARGQGQYVPILYSTDQVQLKVNLVAKLREKRN